MIDFNELKTLYNRCDPYESLDPTDDRNVDLDKCAGEVRGRDWVETLARAVELSDTPVCELFSGFPGSGKSTELRRLLARLSDPKRANLLPVRVDAQDRLDLANAIDISDVMIAVLHETERAVLEAEGKAVEEAMKVGYAERLWRWLTHTEIKLGTVAYKIPGTGVALGLEMRTRPELRELVRKTVARHLSAFLADARGELARLEARAKARGHLGIVVVIDSLEKMQPTTQNWTEVVDSYERLFAGGSPHLRLPVHALYTVPPAVVARALHQVHFLPMVKVHQRDGSEFPPGVDALRELVHKRVPKDKLAAMLGADYEKRVVELIQFSGGYPRDLVRLLRGLITQDVHPVSKLRFDHVLDDLRVDYTRLLTEEDRLLLAEVARLHRLPVLDDSRRALADRMLSLHVVMRYRNGDEWTDVHPALRSVVETPASERNE
ncbi:MAG: hypothetical protein V3V08_07380 [Nannocystaceae bacterium]